MTQPTSITRRHAIASAMAICVSGCSFWSGGPSDRKLDRELDSAALQTLNLNRQEKLVWSVGMRLESLTQQIQKLKQTDHLLPQVRERFAHLVRKFRQSNELLEIEKAALLDQVGLVASRPRKNRESIGARLGATYRTRGQIAHAKAVKKALRAAIVIEKSGFTQKGYVDAASMLDPRKAEREKRFSPYLQLA